MTSRLASRPAVAATCPIPLPIWPAPTTTTRVPMSSMARHFLISFRSARSVPIERIETSAAPTISSGVVRLPDQSTVRADLGDQLDATGERPCDHGRPLHVMPDGVLHGHADTAVELNRLLPDQTGGA